MPTPIGANAPLASLGDVRDAYEVPIPHELEPWVEGLVVRAQRMLLSRRPHVRRWMAEGLIDPLGPADAIVAAVLRVLRNPSGFTAEAEDGYSYSAARDVAAGKLYFTGDDLALVEPPRRRAMGSISLDLPLAPPARRRGPWRRL